MKFYTIVARAFVLGYCQCLVIENKAAHAKHVNTNVGCKPFWFYTHQLSHFATLDQPSNRHQELGMAILRWFHYAGAWTVILRNL